MKLVAHVVLVLAVVAVVSSLGLAPRAKRQLLGDFDADKVKVALANKTTVDILMKCMTASDADAPSTCTPRAKLFRDLTPKLIKKADCPSQCTDQEKQVLAYAWRKLKSDFPEQYQILKSLYSDITPDDWSKFEAWVATIPPL